MADSRTEGRRQGLLEKQREKMMADFEKQRQQIAKDSDVKIGDSKFVSQTDGLESSLKRSTVGLVQLEDFQRIRAELEHQREKDSVQVTDKAVGNEDKKKRPKKKRAKATLSFELEEEDVDGDGAGEKEIQAKKPKLKKNPDVDTSFLPDRERDEEERKIREELRTEWLRNQEELKNETISITYSYWDGSGHRKAVECKKGDNIAQFLEKCRQQFHQLRSISVDNLLYIKEDLIIPHHYTFYDFIINKARGKSGPLFSFDVHEDVRLTNDATLEKDESHAGKVVERSWYERNKHIFPASRWEVFDPEKNYGTYSIKDSKADAVALRAATRKMGGH